VSPSKVSVLKICAFKQIEVNKRTDNSMVFFIVLNINCY